MGRKSVFLLAAALVALVFAVSAFAGVTKSAATTVGVTAGKPQEFGFILTKKSVAKGVVTFKVVNQGAIAHDFKIAGKKTKSIGAGKATTLKITFAKAGKYPYLCTLPSHAAAGMKGVLTVK
jgi:plastocyanin